MPLRKYVNYGLFLNYDISWLTGAGELEFVLTWQNRIQEPVLYHSFIKGYAGKAKKNIELFLRHLHICFKSPALLFFLLLSKNKKSHISFIIGNGHAVSLGRRGPLRVMLGIGILQELHEFPC